MNPKVVYAFVLHALTIALRHSAFSMKRAREIWTRIFVRISRWLAEEWEKEVLRIGTVKSVTYHRKCSGTLCKLLHIFSWFRKREFKGRSQVLKFGSSPTKLEKNQT